MASSGQTVSDLISTPLETIFFVTGRMILFRSFGDISQCLAGFWTSILFSVDIREVFISGANTTVHTLGQRQVKYDRFYARDM